MSISIAFAIACLQPCVFEYRDVHACVYVCKPIAVCTIDKRALYPERKKARKKEEIFIQSRSQSYACIYIDRCLYSRHVCTEVSR